MMSWILIKDCLGLVSLWLSSGQTIEAFQSSTDTTIPSEWVDLNCFTFHSFSSFLSFFLSFIFLCFFVSLLLSFLFSLGFLSIYILSFLSVFPFFLFFSIFFSNWCLTLLTGQVWDIFANLSLSHCVCFFRTLSLLSV